MYFALSLPGLYLLCGILNISAMFSYIGVLYLIRYVEFSFFMKMALMAWESFLFIMFTLDSSLDFITSFNKIGYILSFTGITDALSLLAITSFLFLNIHIAATLQFFRCFRLLKIMQGVKTYPHVFHFTFVDPVPYEILHTATSVVVLLLVLTGAVQVLSILHPHAFESSEPPWSDINYSASIPLYWHECLYFVVVTVTTVGYGDIVPVTTLSRMLMVLIIIIAFSLIPPLLSDLVRAMYSRPRYSGSLSLPPLRKHILICGIVNSAMLLQLLLELQSYQSSASEVPLTASPWSHYRSVPKEWPPSCLSCRNSSVLVVILSPQLPNRKVKILLDSVLATYARRVMYFVGSTKVAQDLQRVKLQDALAVLILGDDPTSSMRVEEDSIFLSTISISNYLEHSLHVSPRRPTDSKCAVVCPRPRLVSALTHSAKLRPLLKSAGVDVVLQYQQFKYSLLGVAAACPGILAIFMKLNRPHFESYAEQYPHYLSSNDAMSFPATANTINSLENLPYMKSTETENSMYQVSVSSGARSELNQGFGENSGDMELCILISNLPNEFKFKDLVSVVFRLSNGSVVLIGSKSCEQNRAPSCSSKKDSSRTLPTTIRINPGRQVRINKCLDLFCIAKTRPEAIFTIKLACRKVLARESVEGPRGHLVLESLESLSCNKLLRKNKGNKSCPARFGQNASQSLSSSPTTFPKEDAPLIVATRSRSAPQLNNEIMSTCSDTQETGEKKSLKEKSFRKHSGIKHSKKIFKGVKSVGNKPRLYRRPIFPGNLETLPHFSHTPFSFNRDRSYAADKGAAGASDLSCHARHGYHFPVSTAEADCHHDNPKLHIFGQEESSTKFRENCQKSVMPCTTGRGDGSDFLNSKSFFNDASSSDLGSLSDEERECLDNHLVLILSSSGTKEIVSSHVLLLSIIHLLTAYRIHSPHDKVVILSERADDLHALATDTSHTHPPALHGVHYFLGSPRNIDHLRMCDVLSARAVVIFHHPTPSAVYVQSDDNPAGVMSVQRKLNTDRNTIIVSLNLHFLLEKQAQFSELQCASNRKRGDTRHNDIYCPFTFTVAEVRHESSVAYLRRSISTISSIPAFPFPTIQDANLADHGNCFDMLSAGGVMTAPVFVSLMLQSILNPNIITLWEELLTGSVDCSLEIKGEIAHSARSSDLPTAPLLTRDVEASSFTSTSSNHAQNDKSTRSSLTNLKRSCSATPPVSRNPSSQQCSFERNGNNLPNDHEEEDSAKLSETAPKRSVSILGRISCPPVFVGLTFGDLFEDLLELYGVVSFGVHRFTKEMKSKFDDASPKKNEECCSESSRSENNEVRNLGHENERNMSTAAITHSRHPGLHTLIKRHARIPHEQQVDGSPMNADCPAFESNDGFDESNDRCLNAEVMLDSDSDSDDEKTRHGFVDQHQSNDKSCSDDAHSMPYVFIAPSGDFIMDRNDFVFILRCP